MAQRRISNESLCTTGFHYTLSLISGKYKMTILYTLMEFGGGPVQRDEAVHRQHLLQDAQRHPEGAGGGRPGPPGGVPPNSAQGGVQPHGQGKSLIPILDNLCQWGTTTASDPPVPGRFSNICLTSSPGYGTIPPD